MANPPVQHKRSQPLADRQPQPRRLPAPPRWLLLLLALIAAALPYWRVLQAGFVWDDQLLLLEWPYYRTPALFGQALWQNVPFSPNYFRPVAGLSFMANHLLSNAQAGGYHLLNLVLHVLTTVVFVWLAYGLLRRLATREGIEADTRRGLAAWLALLLALIFAWHPVHVEAVAFISARFDLLSTLLALVALAGALLLRQTWLAAGVAGLGFLLALGAKEMAVTLPLLVWATARPLPPAGKNRRRAIYGALGLAAVLYLLGRYLSLGYLYQTSGDTLPTGNLIQHMLLAGQSFLRYLWLLIWPFGSLSPIQFADLPVALDNVLAWAGLLLGLALVAALLGWLRRGRGAAWLWLAFLISLLPVLNLVPLDLRGGAFIAERFLYLPSALFLLALGATLLRPAARLWRWAALPAASWKPALFLLVLAPLVAYLLATLSHVPFWQTNDTLWQWAWQQAPRSSLPPSNLAFAALERGDASRALQWAELAVNLDPDNPTAHNNAGAAYMQLGQPDDAVDPFQQAATLRPQNQRYWQNLADALVQAGRYQEAIEVIRGELLARAPESGAAYQLLGKIYIQQGRPEPALEALRQAEGLLPDPGVLRDDMVVALAAAGRGAELLAYMDQFELQYVDEWARLGDMLYLAGDLEHARIAYERARMPDEQILGQLDGASLQEVQARLGTIYLQLDDLQAAEQVAVGMLATNPNEARGHKLMGDVLRRGGSLAGALGAYKQADILAPNTPAILYPLAQVQAELGNRDEALALYERIASLAPDFAAVHYRWGELLWQGGETGAAREHFRRYLQLAPGGEFASQAEDYLNE